MANFEKRDNNLWTVRFRHIVNGKEVNKRLSGFKTKKEAEKAYIEFIKGNITKTDTKDEITFEKLANAYLGYQKKRIKASSLYDQENIVYNHLLPTFGEIAVDKIKPLDVLNWQASIDKYSYKYKTNLRALLVAIFRFGNKYYDLPIPTDKVDTFRNLESKKEMSVWTIDQFKVFIENCPNLEYRVFFSVLFYGGLRKGEAFALQWQDYDFATRKLKITKSITRKERGKAWAITTPKNKNSVRTITIPLALHEELCSLTVTAPTDFIFGKTRPLVDNSTTRYFQDCVKTAKLPMIRLHDLRHSCASHLLSNANGASVSPIAVAKYLGHNVDMLLKTYAHILPSGEEEIVKKFG